MMTLESLRQKIQSQFIDVELGGETWRIGKLGAADYLNLPVGDSADASDGVSNVTHYLSKTLCDGSGLRTFDSDEGRNLLKQLDGKTLLALGTAAYEFNAPEAKKN